VVEVAALEHGGLVGGAGTHGGTVVDLGTGTGGPAAHGHAVDLAPHVADVLERGDLQVHREPGQRHHRLDDLLARRGEHPVVEGLRVLAEPRGAADVGGLPPHLLLEPVGSQVRRQGVAHHDRRDRREGVAGGGDRRAPLVVGQPVQLVAQGLGHPVGGAVEDAAGPSPGQSPRGPATPPPLAFEQLEGELGGDPLGHATDGDQQWIDHARVIAWPLVQAFADVGCH